MQIKDDWLATILCAMNDAIKFNDTLRNSETVTDVEDVEEWLMQIFECKEYLQEEISKNPQLMSRLEKHFKI
ncbi:hypothetical protein MSP8886_03926 [Marinomonas spartinae]|uniref:Uncharacterized protein n=1 Tax=Marinomonas spartinae TaxID=1792290 RepID=A0A1A8TR76_9GAMM|nr:hypothetical protein [Marinomonas spartinae]SBS36978.1 hypothetical protein MSP8886_03926 [Marinomonas spartinae]